ncbi:hypothetical protein O181_060635 [Austropuccinia psidii MF-1]|uniref:Chromo domain-containing protein n=1 Tax=Austropuccinia psidii MF-1 TaxID=1389203 RepID=A0A9Q3EDN7_9BASI|nr:hypothetical protein [Austropuccinia psidii MF-1]
MDKALLIWNRVISHNVLFRNIISGRDPKFKSALWKNLHKLLGTKISSSTAYHLQTDGLAERMIQTLEDMIRRFCAYGLELEDSDGFTNYWCTLIPALELAYKTSIYASKGKTPAMLEKGWNHKLPFVTLRKDLVDIHSTSSRVKIFLDKVRNHANKSMNDAFEYSKQKWDKSHKAPELKVGELTLVSTLNFNNIKVPKKLKDSFPGPFILKSLNGKDTVQVEWSAELEKKHSKFPVSLVKNYTSSDKELFPFKDEKPLEVPPLDQSKKKVLKVLKERRLRGKNEREYLVWYRNPQYEDEWISESKISDFHRFLRKSRHERRTIPQ